jgi:hypothetical protein
VIAIGFLFALAVPFLLVVLYALLPFLSETLLAVFSQASQVSGLLAILYALRMPA